MLMDNMYAHRGVHSSDVDENTVDAFQKAAEELGGFECDVRLSKDGVPVVIHDATLRRTRHHSARVRDMYAAQLSKFGVPLLRDVLPLSTGGSHYLGFEGAAGEAH